MLQMLNFDLKKSGEDSDNEEFRRSKKLPRLNHNMNRDSKSKTKKERYEGDGIHNTIGANTSMRSDVNDNNLNSKIVKIVKKKNH